MESPNPENSAKRKRTPIDESARILHPPMPPNITQVNYLKKSRGGKLRLIEGDSETFTDVLGMIDDYEGVLQRHESLAANLGAKLVSPLLLKSFEKLFEGPIKVLQSSFAIKQPPITWHDIVTFARSNPIDFVLDDSSFPTKTCRFWIKGNKVEISEDDFRLIMSGAPERMIPTQPIPEDESAELGTLDILETRLAMLIKKADTVASKARQLNYHLKGRKTAILARKAPGQPVGLNEDRPFSPLPMSSVNFRPVAPVNNEAAKLQQELLDQFLPSSHRPSNPQSHPRTSRLPATETPAFHNNFNNAHQDIDTRSMSHPASSSDDGIEGHYRVLMAAKIEKLARGDTIHPPCDRCRRLKFECTKYLTACSACTKKHAKCSWKDAKEGELGGMAPFIGLQPQFQGEDNGLDPESKDMEQNDEGKLTVQSRPRDARQDLATEHAVLTQIAAAAGTP
ncbi:hypothetical protein D0Z07_1579 [Hyphodiscus hymeniophilus]|uniref:Zn(2)-C6 fungal-type domain-containing protein n=1 Tax=Hyphodiscus hymeniophilus TaxID=353542 RepID=A0A9P7AZF0_9HELO|nr:hypothetical protein D0Z07_1579 [Hyphodiscus hymeniophilus]